MLKMPRAVILHVSNPKTTDKYPSLVIPGYIYSARREPLTISTETWMPLKKRHTINAWYDYISHEVNVSNELDANLNFQ
jgi:hypothetical protein